MIDDEPLAGKDLSDKVDTAFAIGHAMKTESEKRFTEL